MQHLKDKDTVSKCIEIKKSIELEYKLIRLKEIRLQRYKNRLNAFDRKFVESYKVDVDWF